MKTGIILIFALLLFGDCATTKYNIFSKDREVRLNGFSPSEGYTRRKRFETKFRRVFLLWGLIPIRDTSFEEIIRDETQKGDSVGNVQITEVYDGLDGLIDAVVFGLVRPYSVIVSGDIYTKEERVEETQIAQPSEKEKASEKVDKKESKDKKETKK